MNEAIRLVLRRNFSPRDASVQIQDCLEDSETGLTDRASPYLSGLQYMALVSLSLAQTAPKRGTGAVNPLPLSDTPTWPHRLGNLTDALEHFKEGHGRKSIRHYTSRVSCRTGAMGDTTLWQSARYTTIPVPSLIDHFRGSGNCDFGIYMPRRYYKLAAGAILAVSKSRLNVQSAISDV